LRKLDLFRKIVKHFKRLKTLYSVRNALIVFRNHHPSVKISFEFLPMPVVDPIDRRPLQGIILEWWTSKTKQLVGIS
jgi:hypothetical protein